MLPDLRTPVLFFSWLEAVLGGYCLLHLSTLLLGVIAPPPESMGTARATGAFTQSEPSVRLILTWGSSFGLQDIFKHAWFFSGFLFLAGFSGNQQLTWYFSPLWVFYFLSTHQSGNPYMASIPLSATLRLEKAPVSRYQKTTPGLINY